MRGVVPATGSAPARARADCRGRRSGARAVEKGERRREIVGAELRPHPFGEVELGIGAFPEQEVGQPLLAAGADDEIDVAPQPASPVTSAEQFSRVGSTPGRAMVAALRMASRAE